MLLTNRINFPSFQLCACVLEGAFFVMLCPRGRSLLPVALTMPATVERLRLTPTAGDSDESVSSSITCSMCVTGNTLRFCAQSGCDCLRCLGYLQEDRLLLGFMCDAPSVGWTIRMSALPSAWGSTLLASSGTGSCSSMVAFSDEPSLSTTSPGGCCIFLSRIAASTARLARRKGANCVSAVRAVQRCEFTCCWRSSTICRFELLLASKLFIIDVKRLCTEGKSDNVLSPACPGFT
mmetsp:Transcript_121135/g.241295  ORF Transcript_121135/g.241295 Transcript_121135/m.241295 type:complete len:236 (-) Transcript_121135:77-784(-)